MLLLSPKGSFVGCFFIIILLLFSLHQSSEESILLIGIQDVTQPKLGFTTSSS